MLHVAPAMNEATNCKQKSKEEGCWSDSVQVIRRLILTQRQLEASQMVNL
jgi:hypothetical protein